MHPDDEHLLVVRAVEDADRRARAALAMRQRKSWSSSSADGCLNASTSQPCGFTPDMTCLIVPSLPAASMAWKMILPHALVGESRRGIASLRWGGEVALVAGPAVLAVVSASAVLEVLDPQPAVACAGDFRRGLVAEGSVGHRSRGPGGASRPPGSSTLVDIAAWMELDDPPGPPVVARWSSLQVVGADGVAQPSGP